MAGDDGQIERLLGDDVLDGLESRPLDELRALRAECIDVETGLSYLRRMVQGPLDIVHAEQVSRAGGDSRELADVVDDLADVLSDGTRAGGLGRLPQTLEPTRIDPVLQAELDALIGDGRVASVTTMSDAELASLDTALGEFERKVSAQRRDFHTRIDALQAELTRRYRSGEASVESLLEGERP